MFDLYLKYTGITIFSIALAIVIIYGTGFIIEVLIEVVELFKGKRIERNDIMCKMITQNQINELEDKVDNLDHKLNVLKRKGHKQLECYIHTKLNGLNVIQISGDSVDEYIIKVAFNFTTRKHCGLIISYPEKKGERWCDENCTEPNFSATEDLELMCDVAEWLGWNEKHGR